MRESYLRKADRHGRKLFFTVRLRSLRAGDYSVCRLTGGTDVPATGAARIPFGRVPYEYRNIYLPGTNMDPRQSVCGDIPLHSNYRRNPISPARLKFEFEEPTDYTCPDIEPRGRRSVDAD